MQNSWWFDKSIFQIEFSILVLKFLEFRLFWWDTSWILMTNRKFDKKNKSDRFLLWKLQILRNNFKNGKTPCNLKSWKVKNGKNGLSMPNVIRNGFWTQMKTYGKLWHMALKSKFGKNHEKNSSNFVYFQ